MQATPPPQPQHSVRFRQYQIPPNHDYGRDGNHRTGDKNRMKFRGGLAAIELTKGIEQYANL